MGCRIAVVLVFDAMVVFRSKLRGATQELLGDSTTRRQTAYLVWRKEDSLFVCLSIANRSVSQQRPWRAEPGKRVEAETGRESRRRGLLALAEARKSAIVIAHFDWSA